MYMEEDEYTSVRMSKKMVQQLEMLKIHERQALEEVVQKSLDNNKRFQDFLTQNNLYRKFENWLAQPDNKT